MSTEDFVITLSNQAGRPLKSFGTVFMFRQNCEKNREGSQKNQNQKLLRKLPNEISFGEQKGSQKKQWNQIHNSAVFMKIGSELMD
jgi:hypothetical protein